MKEYFLCGGILILVAADRKRITTAKDVQYLLARKIATLVKDVQYLEAEGYAYIQSFTMRYIFAAGSKRGTPTKYIHYLVAEGYTYTLS